MKKIFLTVPALLCFGLSVSAQTSPKTFDNFDRSQGVEVYVPQPATSSIPVNNKAKRVRGKLQAGAELVKKTAQTSRTAAVTDGLSLREYPVVIGGMKMNMGSTAGLKGFTTGNPLHDSYIVESSRRYNLDPLLIYSQMHQESSFKIHATSHKGASGLMQLMPATARRFGVTSIYDPRQNIDAGVKYMRWLLDTFNGDVVLALAGYNAGEGAVMKYGWNVPPYRETQEYVRRITARYNAISDGRYVQTARSIGGRAANMVQKDTRPLTVYEPAILAVKTSDGKMMLMNQ
jgi:hypothetical protein